MKVKRKISIHDFWNEKHDIITIEVDEVESGIEKKGYTGYIGEEAVNIEQELHKLGYEIDNINYMDITNIKNTGGI